MRDVLKRTPWNECSIENKRGLFELDVLGELLGFL